MTWTGWFKMGDVELANNELTRARAESAPIPHYWFTGPRYLTVPEAFSPDRPYSQMRSEEMPWFDPNQPENSSNFFGVYILRADGLQDSTRQRTITESLGGGGVLSGSRRASKTVKFQAILTARGLEALDYGREWLDAILDADACGQHGNVCGVTDLTFLADVPPARGEYGDADYERLLQEKVRYLHGVGTTSGPFVIEEMESRGVNAVVLEWSVTATRPFVYTATRSLNLPPSLPEVVQDIPYNLISYPSLELTDGTTATIAMNYATNPSVEVNATDWRGYFDPLGGVNPTFTADRSTDLSADRGASFMCRIFNPAPNGNNSGNARVIAEHGGNFPTNAGTRVSFSIWAGAFVVAGAGNGQAGTGGKITLMRAQIQWKNAQGGDLSVTSLGQASASEFNGRVFSAKSVLPPAGAVRAVVQIIYEVVWTSSITASQNSDIRMYADAVAITVP
jgi:hypothetical protein